MKQRLKYKRVDFFFRVFPLHTIFFTIYKETIRNESGVWKKRKENCEWMNNNGHNIVITIVNTTHNKIIIANTIQCILWVLYDGYIKLLFVFIEFITMTFKEKYGLLTKKRWLGISILEFSQCCLQFYAWTFILWSFSMESWMFWMFSFRIINLE